MTTDLTESERRITQRLLAYWEKVRRADPMPKERDIRPEDLGELWDHCFLIYTKDLNKEDYHYSYLGKAISDAYKGELSPVAPGGVVSPSASNLAGTYSRVISTGKPVVDEGVFRNIDRQMVKYRQCMLPIGENGKVKAIFGGMRYKVFLS